MHCPEFNLHQRFSDWPECRLEIRCPVCAYHVSHTPLRMLIEQLGDASFASLLSRLKCKECGARPAPVYLVAGHYRQFCGGGLPSWAIELVPAEK